MKIKIAIYLRPMTGLLTSRIGLVVISSIATFACWAQGPNFKEILQRAAQLPVEERDAFIQKEIHKQTLKKRLNEFTAHVDTEYTPFFKEIGFTDEQNAHFKKRRVELLRLAIEDGDPRQDFISERHAYDLDVKDVMDKTFLRRLDQHPLTKRLPHTVNASVWAGDKDKEYELLYESYGIPESYIEDFKIRRRALHQQAKVLTSPRETLIKAREAYLSRIREVAGEKAFESYQRWELTKQAQRVYEKIKARTTEINLDLLKNNEAAIVELLREANLQLSHNWHCPFGPLPAPMVSQKLMGLQAENDLPQLEKARDTFFAAAKSYKLPAPLLLELHGFFMEELNHLQVMIEGGKDPELKIKFGAFE